MTEVLRFLLLGLGGIGVRLDKNRPVEQNRESRNRVTYI